MRKSKHTKNELSMLLWLLQSTLNIFILYYITILFYHLTRPVGTKPLAAWHLELSQHAHVENGVKMTVQIVINYWTQKLLKKVKVKNGIWIMSYSLNWTHLWLKQDVEGGHNVGRACSNVLKSSKNICTQFWSTTNLFRMNQFKPFWQVALKSVKMSVLHDGRGRGGTVEKICNNIIGWNFYVHLLVCNKVTTKYTLLYMKLH